MGERFDLTKKEAVLERVLQFDPDVIVHCAALSQVRPPGDKRPHML